MRERREEKGAARLTMGQTERGIGNQKKKNLVKKYTGLFVKDLPHAVYVAIAFLLNIIITAVI